MGRVFASLFLASGLLMVAIPACQDDSVYRSGDVPPSIMDGSLGNDGAPAGGGASTGSDGGAD